MPHYPTKTTNDADAYPIIEATMQPNTTAISKNANFTILPPVENETRSPVAPLKGHYRCFVAWSSVGVAFLHGIFVHAITCL